MRHSAFLAILVAVGFVAGACGSDEALTKAEYIEQGNAICADGNAQMVPIFEQWIDLSLLEPQEAAAPSFRHTGWHGAEHLSLFTNFPDEPTQQELVESVVVITAGITPIIEAQLVDLRELAAPNEDEDTLELLFDDLEAVLVEINQLADDVAAGDQAAFDLVQSERFDSFADVNRRAVQYGLTVCADA